MKKTDIDPMLWVKEVELNTLLAKMLINDLSHNERQRLSELVFQQFCQLKRLEKENEKKL